MGGIFRLRMMMMLRKMMINIKDNNSIGRPRRAWVERRRVLSQLLHRTNRR